MHLTAEEIEEMDIEGKMPSSLEILNRGNKLSRFMEDGGGIIVLDGSADNIMSADDMHQVMDSGSLMFTTESVTREMMVARRHWHRKGYSTVFERLNDEGCILRTAPDAFPEEMRIFRKLSTGLGKHHARKFFLENRTEIYKLMHIAMEDMLKKYFCTENRRKRDINGLKGLLMKMITNEDWFSCLNKRESEILKWMGYNRNMTPGMLDRFRRKYSTQYREYLRATPDILAGMGMSREDAEEFSSRYRRDWRNIFMSSMTHMLSDYITTMYMEISHDGSLEHPGVTADNGQFWKQPGNRGMSRHRSMRLMTRRSADHFCSGFENDIELLITGRYLDFNTGYPVGICSTDNDIVQLHLMRDALPY